MSEKDMERSAYQKAIQSQPDGLPTYKKGKMPWSGKEIIDLDIVDEELNKCDE